MYTGSKIEKTSVTVFPGLYQANYMLKMTHNAKMLKNDQSGSKMTKMERSKM